ncbi:MAG: protoporphyrinogen oxidase HemJ [Rhodospirillales bacterium]|nr:protoporphyrinogen oxidase HemJ [Rhodospirillales bacterium]
MSGTLYLWLKALHVISVISWMAALLYMPRLFVYHTQVKPGSEPSELFKVMERRLEKAIMTPAGIASTLFGLALLSQQDFSQGWLHGKLAMVAALWLCHGMMMRWRRDFAVDGNTRPGRYFRIANEIPTLLMIGIVILVVVKPF